MDEELDRRLTEIENLLGSLVVGADSGIDQLELRNELEDVEGRLADRIEDAHESLGQLVGRVESNAAALERVHDRLGEISGTLQDIYREMPTGE